MSCSGFAEYDQFILRMFILAWAWLFQIYPELRITPCSRPEVNFLSAIPPWKGSHSGKEISWLELKCKEEKEHTCQKLPKVAVSQSSILDQHSWVSRQYKFSPGQARIQNCFSDKLARGCSMEFLLDAGRRMRADLAESLQECNKLEFCCSCCLSLGAQAFFFASQGVRMLKHRKRGEINLYQFVLYQLVLYQPFVLCVSCGLGIQKLDLLKDQPLTSEHEYHLVEKGLCFFDIKECPLGHFTDSHGGGTTAWASVKLPGSLLQE